MTKINDLPDVERLYAISAVMRKAREYGVDGMGGQCASVALAMRQAMFDDDAEIVAGLNDSLKSVGTYIGHVCVRVKDGSGGYQNFDITGEAVPDDALQAAGMLDPDEAMWHDEASSAGIGWGEAQAMTASIHVIGVDEAQANFDCSIVNENASMIADAMYVLGYAEKKIRPPIGAV